MEVIMNWMKSLCPLSDKTIRELETCLTPCRFPKRHLLVREGIYCKYAYFIEKGMTRSYWLVDGEEITTSFAGDGCIVETLEEVEAYRILITDLRRLWETNLELSNWGRIIHQNEYRRLHQSHKERLTLPAKERYEAFKQQFPEVCKRVNLGFIASYLGITQSTLSRLRGTTV